MFLKFQQNYINIFKYTTHYMIFIFYCIKISLRFAVMLGVMKI